MSRQYEQLHLDRERRKTHQDLMMKLYNRLHQMTNEEIMIEITKIKLLKERNHLSSGGH